MKTRALQLLGLGGAFVPFLLCCSCGPTQHVELKAMFQIQVVLDGLSMTNKTNILDQCAVIKPLSKDVGKMHPKAKDVMITYGTRDHFAIDVKFSTFGSRNIMTVDGLLFDDSYAQFEKFYQLLLQELSTNFPNRVNILSKPDRLDD